MKRDRSNQPSPPGNAFKLPKEKILRGRVNFQRLFEDEQVLTYFSSHVKILFLLFKDEDGGYKMGFIVPKRLGKAVERNLGKRLLREAYRLNQHMLSNLTSSASIGFHGVFIAKSIPFDFKTAETEVVELLSKIQAYMHSTFKL